MCYKLSKTSNQVLTISDRDRWPFYRHCLPNLIRRAFKPNDINVCFLPFCVHIHLGHYLDCFLTRIRNRTREWKTEVDS
jgi:hypothetical protein